VENLERVTVWYHIERQETSVKAGGKKFLASLFFGPENGGYMFIRNIG
jgi:hypothetical protein